MSVPSTPSRLLSFGVSCAQRISRLHKDTLLHNTALRLWTCRGQQKHLFLWRRSCHKSHFTACAVRRSCVEASVGGHCHERMYTTTLLPLMQSKTHSLSRSAFTPCLRSCGYMFTSMKLRSRAEIHASAEVQHEACSP